jgi:hydrogenase maturation protease
VRDALPEAGRRPLVVGVGNRVRGDDAAGLLAARRLGGIELEGDTSALVELLAGEPSAIVIDAVRSGAPPGTVHRFQVDSTPLPVTLRSSSSSHAVGVSEAIELARALGRLPETVTVLGIEGECFALGAPMSSRVAAAVEAVVALAGQLSASVPSRSSRP